MTFDWHTTIDQSIQGWSWLWVMIHMLYLPTVFGIQHLRTCIPVSIKEHPFYVQWIRYHWAAWNTCLAIFSFFGSYHTFYGVKTILNYGNCEWNDENQAWLNNESGRWMYYFILSKMIELGDSIFLALLGKPIPFLHWYHHLLTSSICVLHLNDMKPWYIMGTFINYSIHSVMYMYYACSALGFYWKKIYAQWITFVQTSQMVAMTYYYGSIWYRGEECSMYVLPSNVIGYSIYLVLFLSYYMNRYLQKVK